MVCVQLESKPIGYTTQLAAGDDLLHWQPLGTILPRGKADAWDTPFAHKPWILKHDGIACHICCAEGNQGRVIALATSKDLHGATGR